MSEFDLLHEVILPLGVGILSGLSVVALGVRSIKEYLREAEWKRSTGDLARFWIGPGKSKTFNLLFGVEKGRDGEVEPRFGYAQAYGLSEIASCLDLVLAGKGNLNLKSMRVGDSVANEVFTQNAVILGGEMSMAWFGRFSRRLEVPFYQYHLDAHSRQLETHPSISPGERVASCVEGDSLLADVGTVTRFINPINGNLIILFNGNYGAGLLGAILSTTRKENFHRDGFVSSDRAQQLVVKVSPIIGNIIDRDHSVQAIRNWIQFRVGDAELRAALSDRENGTAE